MNDGFCCYYVYISMYEKGEWQWQREGGRRVAQRKKGVVVKGVINEFTCLMSIAVNMGNN